MNAVMRIVEYPKEGGVKELSTFSIDEFRIEHKDMSVWYRNRICEQVLNPEYIRVDCDKSPLVITVGYDVKEEA